MEACYYAEYTDLPSHDVVLASRGVRIWIRKLYIPRSHQTGLSTVRRKLCLNEIDAVFPQPNVSFDAWRLPKNWTLPHWLLRYAVSTSLVVDINFVNMPFVPSPAETGCKKSWPITPKFRIILTSLCTL